MSLLFVLHLSNVVICDILKLFMHKKSVFLFCRKTVLQSGLGSTIDGGNLPFLIDCRGCRLIPNSY